MSGINVILNTPGLGEVVFYDYLRCPGELFSVNKRMNAVCQNALKQKLLPELELHTSTFPYSENVEEDADAIRGEESMEVALPRLYEKVDRLIHPQAPIQFDSTWAPIRSLYEKWQREEISQEKNRIGQRLLVYLNEIDWSASKYTQDERELIAHCRLQDLLFGPHAIILIQREKTAARFREVIQQMPQNRAKEPTPSQLLSRLAQEQNNHAENQDHSFDDAGHKMTFGHFCQREQILENQNRSLERLWGLIHVAGAPADDAPAHEIRAWMRQHPQAFNHEDLALDLLEAGLAVPPEIGMLRSLRRLTLTNNHQNPVLPDTFGQLINLETLILSGNNLREIPPVLEQLPALRELDIVSQQPIPVFPDWLDDKINRGVFRWWDRWQEAERFQIGRIDRFFNTGVTGPDTLFGVERNGRYARLARDQFTDIPFNLWFRETFAVPSVPAYASLGLVTSGWRLFNIVEIYRQRGWIGTLAALILPLLPFTVLFGLSFLCPLYVMELLVFTPVFNAILYNFIAPLAEEIWLELGNERMIHIRDLPEAQPQEIRV